MNCGSLVKYGNWYTGPRKTGIIIAGPPGPNSADSFCLVLWDDFEEWEDVCELVMIQESEEQ